MVALVLPHAAECGFGAAGGHTLLESGIEAQVSALLAPPVETKGYPARKKKAARGLGSIEIYGPNPSPEKS